jgi:hypothetical protein
MELWMKSRSSAAAALLNWGTTTGDQQAAMRMGNGHLQFVGGSVSVEGSVAINDGSWHHVAVSYDGSAVRLYVDGAADGSATGLCQRQEQPCDWVGRTLPVMADILRVCWMRYGYGV